MEQGLTGKQEEQEHGGNKGEQARGTGKQRTGEQGNKETGGPRNKETREQSVTISHSSTMLLKFLKTGDLDTIA